MKDLNSCFAEFSKFTYVHQFFNKCISLTALPKSICIAHCPRTPPSSQSLASIFIPILIFGYACDCIIAWSTSWLLQSKAHFALFGNLTSTAQYFTQKVRNVQVRIL